MRDLAAAALDVLAGEVAAHLEAQPPAAPGREQHEPPLGGGEPDRLIQDPLEQPFRVVLARQRLVELEYGVQQLGFALLSCRRGGRLRLAVAAPRGLLAAVAGRVAAGRPRCQHLRRAHACQCAHLGELAQALLGARRQPVLQALERGEGAFAVAPRQHQLARRLLRPRHRGVQAPGDQCVVLRPQRRQRGVVAGDGAPVRTPQQLDAAAQPVQARVQAAQPRGAHGRPRLAPRRQRRALVAQLAQHLHPVEQRAHGGPPGLLLGAAPPPGALQRLERLAGAAARPQQPRLHLVHLGEHPAVARGVELGRERARPGERALARLHVQRRGGPVRQREQPLDLPAPVAAPLGPGHHLGRHLERARHLPALQQHEHGVDAGSGRHVLAPQCQRHPAHAVVGRRGAPEQALAAAEVAEVVERDRLELRGADAARQPHRPPQQPAAHRQPPQAHLDAAEVEHGARLVAPVGGGAGVALRLLVPAGGFRQLARRIARHGEGVGREGAAGGRAGRGSAYRRGGEPPGRRDPRAAAPLGELRHREREVGHAHGAQVGLFGGRQRERAVQRLPRLLQLPLPERDRAQPDVQARQARRRAALFGERERLAVAPLRLAVPAGALADTAQPLQHVGALRDGALAEPFQHLAVQLGGVLGRPGEPALVGGGERERDRLLAPRAAQRDRGQARPAERRVAFARRRDPAQRAVCQLAPPARAQRGEQRRPQRLLPEADPERLVLAPLQHHQVRLAQLLQRLGHLVLPDAAGGTEHPDRGRPQEGGEHVRGAPRLTPHLGEPRERMGDATRGGLELRQAQRLGLQAAQALHDPALLQQPPQRLLELARVAAHLALQPGEQRVQPLADVRLQRRVVQAEAAGGEGRDAIRRQRAQHELAPGQRRLGEQLGERPRPGLAAGEHHEQARPAARTQRNPQHAGQRAEGVGAGALRRVDREKERALGGSPGQQRAGARGERAGAGTAASGGWRAGERGRLPGEGRFGFGQHPHRTGRAPHQLLAGGVIRIRRQLDRACALQLRAGDQVGEQPALADARLAADADRERAPALVDLAQRRPQFLLLALSPHQRRVEQGARRCRRAVLAPVREPPPSRLAGQPPQRHCDLGGGGEALRGLLAQQPLHQVLQRRRHRRVVGHERRRNGGEVLPQHLGIVLALERRAARDHVVERGAERVEVGAPVEGLAADDLRRHVGDRAAAADLVRAPPLARQPEVDQLDPPGPARLRVRRHQHVARLEVQVQIALGVDVVEHVEQLQHQRVQPLEARRLAAPDLGGRPEQIGAAHQLGGEEEEAPVARGAEVVDLEQVRVAQPGQHAELVAEIAHRHAGQLRARDELQRQLAPLLELVGDGVDRAHAAAADPPPDAVAIGDRGARHRPHRRLAASSMWKPCPAR
ncbi:MAG: hypothetical protein KatS3mg102_1919 [Planctomycetota bacterium]|nr:MAG: hypothetical protein KatS3mg102_1919 [Planctomycetota bacterium]